MADQATYRQGDVLLVKQDLPRSWLPMRRTVVPRDNGRLVLAYGEVTGHAHVIDAPEAEATLLTDGENERFLALMADTTLSHEEHAALDIPAGTYRVVQQEQFSPPSPMTGRASRTEAVWD